MTRDDIRGSRYTAVHGVMTIAERELRDYDAAKEAGKDLESTAKEALEFIRQLRESTNDEAIDLLSNNPGEDVEAELAEALGIPLADSDAGVTLRREASHQTKGACGDIEYYFNSSMQEIGFIAFPGTEHERVVRHIRHWDHKTLDAHNIVSVRPVGRASVRLHCREYQESMDFLIRLTCCAELSQDSLEETTKELLDELQAWMEVPEGPDNLQVAARNAKAVLDKLISAYSNHVPDTVPACPLQKVMHTGEPQACWEALRRAL